MADINQVMLIGRLTRDAELKYANSGFAIANFSLAVDRNIKKDNNWQDEVNFFNAVIFGKRAEALAQYLTKGKQIAIQGELRQNRWEQEGQPRSKVEIVVNNIQLLQGRGGAPSQAQGPSAAAEEPAAGQPGPGTDDFSDDIPF